MAFDTKQASRLSVVVSERIADWVKDEGGEIEANILVSALIGYAASVIRECPDPEQRLRFMGNAIVALVSIVDAQAVVSVHSSPEAIKAVLGHAMDEALAKAKPVGSA